MIINIQNVEEIIFYDTKIMKLMPEFTHIFDQWKLSQQISGMRTLGKRTLLEFINSLQDNHIKILEDYFKTDVVIQKINNKLVENISINTEEEINDLCHYSFYSNFCVTTTNNGSFMTFWR